MDPRLKKPLRASDAAGTGEARVEPVRDALLRAVARVQDRCSGTGVGPPEPAVLLGEIERTADLVDVALSGTPPDPPEPVEADREALLELLRAEVLSEWPEEREGLLEVMRAFETVRAALEEARPSGALPTGVLTPYGHRLLREVAHTLRSPLGSIVILAETLQEAKDAVLGDRQREQLRIIQRAALSVAALAGDLLSLTREDEEVDREPVPFDVHRLLEQVADLVRPVTEQRGVGLEVRVSGPETRVGQPTVLRRVLLNLALQTAVRARSDSVVLAAGEDGDDAASFSVTGPAEGVSPDEAFAAFRPAEEGAGYSMSAGGLGCGIARHLVRRLGSELTAERTEGDGLRLSFHLELPSA